MILPIDPLHVWILFEDFAVVHWFERAEHATVVITVGLRGMACRALTAPCIFAFRRPDQTGSAATRHALRAQTHTYCHQQD